MSDVFVTGINAYVPQARQSIVDAIADGVYDESRARTDGFSSVAVETTLSSPEMALRTAMPLVADADAGMIRNLYLTHVHRHGHRLLWPPASYLQRRLGLASDARAMSISQGCNGAFIAASIACDMIRAGIPGDHLVVGADRFSGSGFDRWNSDLGTLYGDAAAAIRLSHRPGKMRVAFWALEGEPELEEMYREAEPSPEGPDDHRIKEAKRTYLERHGREHFNTLFTGALERLRSRLIEAVDLVRSPAAFVIYPNVGAGLSAALYEKTFGDLARRSAWDYGRSIGHTGTSDQIAGLCNLIDEGALGRGNRVLLIGAGNGLSLAAFVLEQC
jgi:3-oxoacyl-[acyl-carrier-protein] synthase-3